MEHNKLIEIDNFARFLQNTYENVNGYDFTKPLTSVIISQNYRSILEDCMTKCDKEITRFGVIAISEYTLEDLRTIVLLLKKRIETITEIFINIPRNIGKTVMKELYIYFLNFFSILNGLPGLMRIQNNHQNLTKHIYLICEACAELKDVPKDNKDAALKLLNSQQDLTEDAYVELSQNLDSNDAFDTVLDNGYNVPPQWSDKEKHMLNAVLGLIKCAKTVLKKLGNGISDLVFDLTESQITSLDALSVIVNNTSGKVDDLVLASYPPLFYEELNEEVQTLVKHLKSILDIYSSSPLKKDSHKTWIDFLRRAIDHNSNKLLNPIPDLQNLTVSEDSSLSTSE